MSQLRNDAAEWAIAASLLQHPQRIPEIIGSQLAAEDFLRGDARALYATTVESYYADQPTDPVSIAEKLRKVLAREWGVQEARAGVELIQRIAERDMSASALDHARIVKRLALARKLLSVAGSAQDSLAEGRMTPEQIAATMSAEALAITSGTARRAELYSWMDTGREYARYLQRQRSARQKGIELAMYSGFPFVDDFTKGIAPTELAILAGPPGSGKSILGWKVAEAFAERQMRKPADERVGTLVVSMEMSLIPSSTRLAQSISGIDGVRLREGLVNDQEYAKVLREWKARDGLPLHFNYASNFRLSQLRALVVEAVRRYNVGFVVLDHFRQLDTDEYVRDVNDRDEQKVRWLKEAIGKDLNVAVLCIAHTLKLGRASEGNPVPRMADLRGSGQIAANADLIALLHRPYKNASEAEQLAVNMQESDAELIWVKSRHAHEGTGFFSLDAATMTVRPR